MGVRSLPSGALSYCSKIGWLLSCDTFQVRSHLHSVLCEGPEGATVLPI